MDEQDAELTRKAIEEIFHDMQEHRKREELPQERKINPLGRTNKNFLGRTLHAMVRHNKRADEKNRKKCKKRLRELDRYRNNSEKKSSYKKCKKKKHEQRTDTESTSSDTSTTKRKRRKTKSKHKKKKKRHAEEKSSSSKSRRSSLNSPPDEIPSSFYNNYDYENNDYNAAYMMWDLQMQQFYQYKALMTLGAAEQATTSESVQIVEIKSSSPSLSDIKLEESSSSSSEEHDNIYTINVSTDSDNDGNKNKMSTKNVPTELRSKETDVNLSIEIIDSDSISVKSVLSITSTENAIDLTED